MIDGSNDSRKKEVYNIIGGILYKNKEPKTFLLDQIVDSDGSAGAIANKIDLILHRINQDVLLTKQHFKLFVTDSAPACTAAGSILKQFCPNMKHSTCLAHFFHNFSKKISEAHPKIEKFNALLIKVFQKSPFTRRLFYEFFNLYLPPTPVKHRWGTMFKYIGFIFMNFDTIISFIDNNYKKIKKFIDHNDVEFIKNELAQYEKYLDLPRDIEKLSSNKMKCTTAYDFLKKIEATCTQNEILTKYVKKFLNTADNMFFYRYSYILASPSEKIDWYAPVVSVEVERSFNIFNYIIDETRTRTGDDLAKALLFIKNFYLFNS